MRNFVINIEKPLRHMLTGKFVSSSPDWKHMSRLLLDYELFVSIKGVLYIADEHNKYEVREGEYLILPPRTKQYGHSSSDCSFYWLHFLEGDVLSTAVVQSQDGQPLTSITIPETGTLSNKDKLIVLLNQLQDSVHSYNDPILNNYVTTSILCELHNQAYRKMDQPQFKKQQLYNDIVDFVKLHRLEPMQVSQIADHFGYNAKYLSQLFAKASGTTLKRYIMQQKIDAATFLLTESNMTIAEISTQLGYQDSQHFMKSFKLLMHVTPSEYRHSSANRVLNH